MANNTVYYSNILSKQSSFRTFVSRDEEFSFDIDADYFRNMYERDGSIVESSRVLDAFSLLPKDGSSIDDFKLKI